MKFSSGESLLVVSFLSDLYQLEHPNSPNTKTPIAPPLLLVLSISWTLRAESFIFFQSCWLSWGCSWLKSCTVIHPLPLLSSLCLRLDYWAKTLASSCSELSIVEDRALSILILYLISCGARSGTCLKTSCPFLHCGKAFQSSCRGFSLSIVWCMELEDVLENILGEELSYRELVEHQDRDAHLVLNSWVLHQVFKHGRILEDSQDTWSLFLSSHSVSAFTVKHLLPGVLRLLFLLWFWLYHWFQLSSFSWELSFFGLALLSWIFLMSFLRNTYTWWRWWLAQRSIFWGLVGFCSGNGSVTSRD